MNKEIEAKFLHVDKETIRNKLLEIGFILKHSEYTMKRKTFDFSKISPNKNKWGRVRQEFDKVTMAIKEIVGTGIKDVYETELIVNDFDNACLLFEECGILAKSFQENKREEWFDSGVSITIDTWPGLHPFVEIEADTVDLVKEYSKKLGFIYEQAVFGSIDAVYEIELGIPKSIFILLPEVTFANLPIKNPKH
jgi:adenylate cyclase class IV